MLPRLLLCFYSTFVQVLYSIVGAEAKFLSKFACPLKEHLDPLGSHTNFPEYQDPFRSVIEEDCNKTMEDHSHDRDHPCVKVCVLKRLGAFSDKAGLVAGFEEVYGGSIFQDAAYLGPWVYNMMRECEGYSYRINNKYPCGHPKKLDCYEYLLTCNEDNKQFDYDKPLSFFNLSCHHGFSRRKLVSSSSIKAVGFCGELFSDAENPICFKTCVLNELKIGKYMSMFQHPEHREKAIAELRWVVCGGGLPLEDSCKLILKMLNSCSPLYNEALSLKYFSLLEEHRQTNNLISVDPQAYSETTDALSCGEPEDYLAKYVGCIEDFMHCKEENNQMSVEDEKLFKADLEICMS